MILAPTLLLNAGSGAAITRPTFSRDFAGEKTLNNGTGPAITFTRASNATFFDASGTLQTAANDTPRFDHDPATAGNPSRGLLIEEARTNLLERSAEFDNATWSKSGGTITANADTAPDGTTTADKFVESAVNQTHQVFQTVTGVAAIQTASFFVKAAGRTSCQFLAFNATDSSIGRVNVDLTNGTTSSVLGTATATSVGNGWYRVAVTYTPTVTNTSFNVFPREGGSTSYLGDGTSGILIWGAQLEQGAFATSYIPTTTAAATRAADSAVVTPISSFYNQSEGTLFAEFSRNQVVAQGRFLSFTNATDLFLNFLNLETGYGNPAIHRIISTNGTSVVSGPAAGNVVGTIYKLSGGYSSTSIIAAQNGVLETQAAATGTPTGIDSMAIGATRSTTTVDRQLNGHIRKLAYWPRRLSNTLLQQLTT
jgi:hypothetical protein